MTAFAFIQSKIKDVNDSLGAICRRCKLHRHDPCTPSGLSSGAPSPTTSSFSKKGIFSKRSPRNLWRCRRARESRDDFGNRWSKIYIPGDSRSATPLPDIYPVITHPCDIGRGEDEEKEDEPYLLVNNLEIYGEPGTFGVRAVQPNSPYSVGSVKRRSSWLL